MAEVILDWFDDGLNSETFFIVGHSLGAQMAAIIGRSVAKKSRGEKKIERISALDPALPSTFTSGCINKNDAKFVDIVGVFYYITICDILNAFFTISDTYGCMALWYSNKYWSCWFLAKFRQIITTGLPET